MKIYDESSKRTVEDLLILFTPEEGQKLCYVLEKLINKTTNRAVFKTKDKDGFFTKQLTIKVE